MLSMANYIKYKRISKVVNEETLQELLDGIIEEGFEIIYYDEKILDPGVNNDPLSKSDNTMRMLAIILCGKINEGKKMLNS